MSGQIFGQVIISGLLLGGVYALISIGLTLIFGVIRIVNFAHGEFLMLSMYITFWSFHYWGWDPYFSLAFVTLTLFVFGLAAHRSIIQPLLGAPRSCRSLQLSACLLRSKAPPSSSGRRTTGQFKPPTPPQP